MANLWYKIVHFFSGFISNFRWVSWRKALTGRITPLTDEQLALIKDMLAKDYYIILTYNKAHASNWFISLLCYLKTGKFPQYAHALMNVDNITDSNQSEKFKLMEATHNGVEWAGFDDVFNCDRVCLLRPASLPIDQWTAVIDRLIKSEGVAYDDFYDLANSNRESCVEVVRNALMAANLYASYFVDFEKAIADVGNLTPQMFRDCDDFVVELEILK